MTTGTAAPPARCNRVDDANEGQPGQDHQVGPWLRLRESLLRQNARVPQHDQTQWALSCLESASSLTEDPVESESAARPALEPDPVSETAACQLRALARQGRRDEGVKLYHQFVPRLQRELALPPGPELARAYLELTS